MTWGFPSITAFTGMMTALERRMGRDSGIALLGVGVICHDFDAQVTEGRYSRAFRLTRNPVGADGGTLAIVEEGRIHLDVTLVFEVQLSDERVSDAARAELAARLAHEVAGMRLAGGSIMPPHDHQTLARGEVVLELLPDEQQPDERRNQFRRLMRRWLPGFALVSRDDLLQDRLIALRATDTSATLIDAWLDLSRWNVRAVRNSTVTEDETKENVDWVRASRAGWTVPIPVGFSALSPLYAAGTVQRARDAQSPFRFVETVWSMAQWISPHRLHDLTALVWYPDHDEAHPSESGLYRCRNDFVATVPADPASAHHN
jgi:CRISPR-associated protein Csy2